MSKPFHSICSASVVIISQVICIKEWRVGKMPRCRLKLSVSGLRRNSTSIKMIRTLQILDVRSDGEWEKGRVPNAQHIYVAHLEENLEKLDKSNPSQLTAAAVIVLRSRQAF